MIDSHFKIEQDVIILSPEEDHPLGGLQVGPLNLFHFLFQPFLRTMRFSYRLMDGPKALTETESLYHLKDFFSKFKKRTILFSQSF